jgi:hypothetical protein
MPVPETLEQLVALRGVLPSARAPNAGIRTEGRLVIPLCCSSLLLNRYRWLHFPRAPRRGGDVVMRCGRVARQEWLDWISFHQWAWWGLPSKRPLTNKVLTSPLFSDKKAQLTRARRKSLGGSRPSSRVACKATVLLPSGHLAIGRMSGVQLGANRPRRVEMTGAALRNATVGAVRV